ncbi:hypothetical protein BDY21DRAFT_258884, partial [Lineolata rhizophorae]
LSQYSVDDATAPQSEGLKRCSNPSPSGRPLHYLDPLSKIWLTSGALRELNRRTNWIKPTYRHRPQGRRPLT